MLAKEMILGVLVEFPREKPPWTLAVLVAEAKLDNFGRKPHEWFVHLHDDGDDGESEGQTTSLQAMPKDRSNTKAMR